MRHNEQKVYVVNKGGHDYSDARRFGELVYLSEGTQNRFAVSSLYRQFVDVMEGSQPHDYILVTSMNVLNSIAAAVFARKHGKLNMLLFKNGRYEPRELDIDSLLWLDDVSDDRNSINPNQSIKEKQA